MKRAVLPLLLATALALGACATTGAGSMLAADAPRALPEQGPVSVSWADPLTFSEIRSSGNRYMAAQGDWLQDLAEYMRERAERQLPAGNTLQLTIVDIQRAGRYEPWRGPAMQDARIIRDLYPPRMTVRFRQLDASGAVVDEGERRITDPAFLVHSQPLNQSDSLRYEKRMIDSWLRREFRGDASPD